MNKDIHTDPALRGINAEGIGRSNLQLSTFDYMAGIPGNDKVTDLIEVQFKSTRKAFYRNSKELSLKKGDIICVEASPGYDVGVVSLTGSLVLLQMKKKRIEDNNEIKHVLRKADTMDLDILKAARDKEKATMIRTRQIAKELELNMKISDVEFQGDGKKAIFYYIADQRVDFRKLIKVLAEAFEIRVEMRQIGARQEAALVGGIGSCGRELCSATWKTHFETISTHAARLQDLSLNPSKLTGVCGKLKSCLNYELALYEEAYSLLPDRNIALEVLDGTYYFYKADVLQQRITYSTDKKIAANLVTIHAKRAHEIIAMNQKGEKPDALDAQANAPRKQIIDLAEQDDLTRFDNLNKPKKRKKKTAAQKERAARKGRNESEEKGARQRGQHNAERQPEMVREKKGSTDSPKNTTAVESQKSNKKTQHAQHHNSERSSRPNRRPSGKGQSAPKKGE